MSSKDKPNEKNIRSFAKGLSWRVLATGTTVTIVYLFFGRLDMALAAGVVEATTKIALYWAHERVWQRIHWGIRKVEPFNLWFTGLPLSGKTTIADKVYNKLKGMNIKAERIDSKEVRSLFPDVGFTREERNRHIRRVAHLVSILQKNGISAVCSFVSPYAESREEVRKMTKNPVIVYVKTSIETCKKRDYKGVYEKAINGQIKNFTGISDTYEEPQSAEITIDTEKIDPDEAANIIVRYIKKRFII